MKIKDWLKTAFHELQKADITTARLDCLVLLEDASGKDRSYLLAHGDEELESKVVQLLDEQITRRVSHEPLAYIRGRSEFYGREFMVNEHTLQPRPETETMITMLKTHVLPHVQVRPVHVVDVGTGSGCIAVTVKLEIPHAQVIGTDVSKECIRIAGQNAQELDAEIEFYQGNLLQPVKDKEIDIILCNLPYVPNDFTINQAAMQEPKLAIFGGVDGLDLYRELFAQVKKHEHKPEFILAESLPFQHHTLATMARQYGYALEETDDFIQQFSLL